MINHFKIFDLNIDFNINLDELENKYLEFQKAFHPDKSGASDIEKSISVNEAYKILQNPLSRISHILQLNSIDIENDENAPKVDFTTLSEVLEIREKILDSTKEEVIKIKKELSSKIKSLLDEAVVKLENKDLEAVTQIVIRAKYFDKTLRDLKTKK